MAVPPLPPQPPAAVSDPGRACLQQRRPLGPTFSKPCRAKRSDSRLSTGYRPGRSIRRASTAAMKLWTTRARQWVMLTWYTWCRAGRVRTRSTGRQGQGKEHGRGQGEQAAKHGVRARAGSTTRGKDGESGQGIRTRARERGRPGTDRLTLHPPPQPPIRTPPPTPNPQPPTFFYTYLNEMRVPGGLRTGAAANGRCDRVLERVQEARGLVRQRGALHSRLPPVGASSHAAALAPELLLRLAHVRQLSRHLQRNPPSVPALL